MFDSESFSVAFGTRNIRQFLHLMFPPEWKAISARIIESGVTFSRHMTPWAPRWTKISPTVRNGDSRLHTDIKSCIYRVHDCLHQLWGLPIPSGSFDDDDFYLYKRAQMCGEVAVLTLTEFVFVDLVASYNPSLRPFLETRNAIGLLRGPLSGKSAQQIAARLDDVLHKKRRPKWVRDSSMATAFADDYIPMLEEDRKSIDSNWEIMKSTGWRPDDLPNSRYSRGLDGLELTTWMINDFFHLLDTDSVIDENLTKFNMDRREKIVLPHGWR